jgi:hypothetical protein
VNIRIGVSQSPKELEVELDDEEGAKAVEELSKAVKDEASMIWLTDKKGRRVGVPTAKLAWVEVGAEADSRRVGFAAL